MVKQKKALVAGGVAVALGCAWWGLSAYASHKAEDHIVDFLEKIGQRDMVRWKRVSASPFGSATLKDVTIGSPAAPSIRIESVSVSDFRDDRDHKSADITLDGAALPDGRSPLSQLDSIRQAGKIDLPPATLNVKWDYRADDDKANIQIDLRQPQALNVDLSVGLERVNAAVTLTDPAVVGKLAGMGIFGLFGVTRMMEPLAQMRIKDLNLTVKDDGYVKRSVELYKRYNISVVPGQGSADKQRDTRFDQKIKATTEQCIKNHMLAGFSDNKDACEALIDFVSGDEKTLTFSSTTRTGVSVADLTAAGMGDPDKLLALFVPKLSN